MQDSYVIACLWSYQVAECGEGGEIVGVVRGCIKTVTRGIKVGDFPIYVKLAYVLGLRVSHMHR